MRVLWEVCCAFFDCWLEWSILWPPAWVIWAITTPKNPGSIVTQCVALIVEKSWKISKSLQAPCSMGTLLCFFRISDQSLNREKNDRHLSSITRTKNQIRSTSPAMFWDFLFKKLITAFWPFLMVSTVQGVLIGCPKGILMIILWKDQNRTL